MKNKLKVVRQVRVDRDVNGRPIPIYRICSVERSKEIEAVYSGKSKVMKVKL